MAPSLGALLLVACVATNDADSAEGASGECFYGCDDSGPVGGWDASTDAFFDEESDAGTEPEPIHPLCGVGSCHPDFADSCAVGAKAASEEGASDVGQDADSGDEDAGAEDDAGPGDDGDVGEDPGGDDADPGEVDGGETIAPPNDAGTDDPDTKATVYACQVRASTKGPERTCVPAGEGKINAPCISSKDCAPGLACVGPENAGICRPYCCGDPEGCPESTYCEVRELRDDASESPISVPVCVPAMNCKLLEAEPCASLGLICGIVRADGTTSCVPPGTGKLNEPCPCAYGYVCAKSSNKCLKLCRVANASAECPGGTCQGGTGNLPPGFGVCVGGYEDAG